VTARPPSARYLLLRVERSRREGSASPVRSFATFDEAITAAAEQPHQPSTRWRPDWVDGVWRQVDWTGRGFVVHRIDDPAPESVLGRADEPLTAGT
jgi:hypothetical protein